jgi:hypothetical protein
VGWDFCQGTVKRSQKSKNTIKVPTSGKSFHSVKGNSSLFTSIHPVVGVVWKQDGQAGNHDKSPHAQLGVGGFSVVEIAVTMCNVAEASQNADPDPAFQPLALS